MRGSRNFCQFFLVLSLFYSLKRGSNGFIAEKTILILYKGSRGGPLFSGGGGGVSILFSRVGPNANFYRNTYTPASNLGYPAPPPGQFFMGAKLFIGTPWMGNEGVLKKILVWAM